MIVDRVLEGELTWERKAGPDIGGPTPWIPPDYYGFNFVPGALRFDIRGKPWTAWLAALHRPFIPGSRKLALSTEFMTDAAAWDVSQIHELDVRAAFNGYDFNHSFQLNNAAGGMLQISGQAAIDTQGKVTGGPWVDTGIKYGKLTPRTWYRIRLQYGFDIANLTYRTESIKINDEMFSISLPLLKAVKAGWTDGAHVQVQQCLAGQGGAYSVYHRNMQLDWKP